MSKHSGEDPQRLGYSDESHTSWWETWRALKDARSRIAELEEMLDRSIDADLNKRIAELEAEREKWLDAANDYMDRNADLEALLRDIQLEDGHSEYPRLSLPLIRRIDAALGNQ